MNAADLKALLIRTGGNITGESEEADRQRIVKYWLIHALDNGLENSIIEWVVRVKRMEWN